MIKFFLITCLVVGVMGVSTLPSIADIPSPATLHMSLDQQKEFRVSCEVTTIKETLLSNIEFLGASGLLTAKATFSTSSFDPKSFVRAKQLFVAAGWDAQTYSNIAGEILFVIVEPPHK